MSDGGASEAPDHVVFVVHGVGDPQPADALTALVDSYCACTSARPAGPRLSSALKDEPAGSEADAFIHTFPVNRIDTVRTEAGRSERTRFVEVYWGDLSRVKGSAAGLLLGTIDLVFGLRHIVKAARLEIGALPLPGWIKQPALWAGEMGSASQGLIRGPLLALNLFAAIVVALFLMDTASRLPLTPSEAALTVTTIDRAAMAFGPCAEFIGNLTTNPFATALSESGRLTPEAVYCTSGGLGLPISGGLGLALGVVLVLLALARGWSVAMASWLAAAGAVCLLWWAWSLRVLDSVPTYARLVEDLTGVLSLGATLVGLLVIGMLVLSLLASALAVAFERGAARPLRRALTVINVCTTLSTALFVLLLMVAWATLSRQIDIAVLAKRIEGGLHLFVVVWFTFVLIGGAYGWIVVSAWRRKRARANGRAVKFPRYIVGWQAVAAVIVAALLWPVVFVPTVVTLECNDGQRIWEALGLCGLVGGRSSSASAWILDVVHALDAFVSVGIMLSIGALIVLFAARAHFGTALDIVLDVVSHFSLSSPPNRDKASVWRVVVTRMAQSVPFWPRRAMAEHAIWHTIVRRFCAVMEDTLRAVLQDAPAGHAAPRVSVLAHSQGTMIALEGLGAIAIERRGNFPAGMQPVRPPATCDTIRLVTMGCPLSHLYMHYFPRQYDTVRAPRGTLHWLNIFRADDFVGRAVAGAAGRFQPHNIEVGPRGHVDYWSDREVLNLLVRGEHKVL